MNRFKKLISCTLCLTILLSSFLCGAISVNAEDDLSYGDFEYSLLDDGTVSISKYTGTDKNVNIPSVINKRKVTEIGYDAFKECVNMESVIIPNGVKEIRMNAFNGCTRLIDVNIPNTVNKIGNYVFNNCTSLKNIEIPDSVKNLGDDNYYSSSVFSGCKRLENVTLPKSIHVLNSNLFENCESLKSITIPNSVYTIKFDVFNGCKSLTNIVIPDSVREIGGRAFSNCTNLKDIKMSKNILSLSYSIFDNTYWYNNQPDGIIYLDNVLYGYKGDMPSNTVINVKDGTRIIAGFCFEDCSNLVDVNIPDSVINVGRSAFIDTAWLNNKENGIVYAGKVAYCYKGKLDDDSVLYLKNDTIGVADGFYPEKEVLDGDIDVVLPESLVCVGSYAFGRGYGYMGSGSSSLKNINLPNNLKYICSEGFSCCKRAEGSLSIPKSVEYIGEDAFYNCGFNTIKVNNKDCIVMDKAFGYDLIGYGYMLKKDFKLYGYSNSTADTYAKENGITFVALDKKTNPVIKATSVKLNKKTLNLTRKNANVSAQLIGKVAPNNATNSKLSWKSSNTKVATVTQNGKIIGKSRGTAKITVTTTDGSNISATCNVTVRQLVTKVTLNKKAISLKAKGKAKQKTYTLKATVSKDANNKKVKWTTSNKKVAVVNSKGKVTAKKKGTCYISVTSTDGSRKSAKCKVTVK